MRKFEILSPAGDLECLKTAINAGADAVYFGLNKFNARMKADNISLDNLSEVVEFAHMRGVKLYVTINTLVSNSELTELVEMVGECLHAGVDAFIVQDYGVIFALKAVYPNIVLHGSTQLGVHNVRGALVAKSLGLSRVVLSREVTLGDIRDIREHVDIELEVFVQGAMCVAFSGNCYLSSLKHGASGNRGLCKQLCRLPYTLSNNRHKKQGYILSPRDNCMMDYLKQLCDIGVVSFKIEGRLRRAGYVAVATREYRKAIDCIEASRGDIDIDTSKHNLKKVFARGEFVSGYFDGNDIIDTEHNNHMGEKVGAVARCERFKDMYKLAIETDHQLHCGDGIKCVDGSNVVSFGVGNVQRDNKYAYVFVKNYIERNSVVYRVLDSEFENMQMDIARLNKVDMVASLTIGQPIRLTLSAGDYHVSVDGAIVQEAKSKPLTEESVITQLAKVGGEFEVSNIQVEMSGQTFVPVSAINEVRREGIQKLKDMILDSYKNTYVKNKMPQVIRLENKFDNIAIVDEKTDISKLNQKYSRLVLSPTVYSVSVINTFAREYEKYFDNSLIINLPIIALRDDIQIIDDIANLARTRGYVLLANNIYGLSYINDGNVVWAGVNMNITNDYAVTLLKSRGVEEIVSSMEKWCQGVGGAYRLGYGKRVLMTFAHCPNKTLSADGSRHASCEAQCLHKGLLNLEGEGVHYTIRRYVVANCYFELVDSVVENKSASMIVDDLRS